MRLFVALSALIVLGAACSPANEPDASPATATGGAPTTATDETGVASGLEAAERALVAGFGPELDGELIDAVVAIDDPRAGWLLSDLLRFYPVRTESSALLAAGLEALGYDADPRDPWTSSVNQLIAEDVPAAEYYDELKVNLLLQVEGRWARLFSSPLDIDLRYVNWGGVFIDDREWGHAGSCFGRGCIPALDRPVVTSAEEGQWYADDRVVFGVVVNGEARAYPKHQMQVHEMVNDIVGGRRIAMPYCTLCGSAQAYFTDEVPGVDSALVMRTSGLLHRSNKVMYDLDSGSVFDTFTGEAVTGTHRSAGVKLEQISVRVATWGEWKDRYPDTTIVAPDGGVGRIYPDDPLGGRDDDGPIFPVGPVDARAQVHDAVVGVETPDGEPVAFLVDGLAELGPDDEVEFAGVTIRTDGAGYLAFDGAGDELVTHEAFWFAWSQFFPATQLWEGPTDAG